MRRKRFELNSGLAFQTAVGKNVNVQGVSQRPGRRSSDACGPACKLWVGKEHQTSVKVLGTDLAQGGDGERLGQTFIVNQLEDAQVLPLHTGIEIRMVAVTKQVGEDADGGLDIQFLRSGSPTVPQ